MIAALVGWYLALVCVAGAGSHAAWRYARQFPTQAFLRPFALFVTLGFGHGLVTFVAEVFAPIVAPESLPTQTRLHMAVDLVTIPLLAVMFWAAFRWIRELLARRAPRLAWWALGAVEVVFLLAFATVTVTVLSAGRPGASARLVVNLAVFLMNAIIAGVAVTAVSVLLLVRPLETGAGRMARDLGVAYGLSLTVLGVLLAPVAPAAPRGARAAIVSTAVVLLNVPAVVYLRRRLAACPPAAARVEGAALTRLADTAGLSGREVEVLALVIAGFDTRGIGERLFISPKTVKNHITSIYAKTGAKNRVQLSNLACER